MASFGFSWADEVEREEQEEMERAKRKHEKEEEEEEVHHGEDEKQQRKRRPDPFGAARPREVVLEEKGVDWRKLDRELGAHSRPVATSSLSRKQHPQKKPEPNARSLRPQQQQNIEELVPQLRYPPKNISSLMEQIRKGRSDLNGVLGRYPCKSNTNPMHHFSINPAHSLIRVPEYNMSMVEVGQVRMHTNVGFIRPSREMGSNSKKECVGARFIGEMENCQVINLRNSCKDDSYYSDHIKNGIRRGGNYGKETNAVVTGEEMQANRRIILNDLNMERTNKRKNNRVGEAQTWDYNEGRKPTARKCSNFEEWTCQTIEPQMLTNRKQNSDIEHNIHGQNHRNKCLRQASGGTAYRVNDTGGEFAGHSTSKDVSSGKENNNKKRLPSAPKSGPSRRNKQRNQDRK